MTETNNTTTTANNGANASTGAATNSTNQANGAEEMVPQTQVNSIVARETRNAETRGADTFRDSLLERHEFDTVEELDEFIGEMRQVAQSVETDNDRQQQRTTRLERQNGTLTQERDQWRDRFFDSQRANALGNELLSLGINPARAEIAIQSARGKFGELDIDDNTFEVSGVKELARNIKKQSPEWFPEQASAPDASRSQRIDNSPVTAGVGRLTRYFGGA